jgi:hypothetical protein
MCSSGLLTVKSTGIRGEWAKGMVILTFALSKQFYTFQSYTKYESSGADFVSKSNSPSARYCFCLSVTEHEARPPDRSHPKC